MRPHVVALVNNDTTSLVSAKIMQTLGFVIHPLFIDTNFDDNFYTFHKSKYKNLPNVLKNSLEIEKIDAQKDFVTKAFTLYKDNEASLSASIFYKIFLLEEAKQYAKQKNISFISTGEMLDLHHLSQDKKNFYKIEMITDTLDHVIRPLSGQLLKKTNAEKKFLFQKEQLFSFTKENVMELENLKKYFEIEDYDTKKIHHLSESELASKAFELIGKDFFQKQSFQLEQLLQFGFHFKLDTNSFLVVGKNDFESTYLKHMIDTVPKNRFPYSYLLDGMGGFHSIGVLISNNDKSKNLETACSILASFSKINRKTGNIHIYNLSHDYIGYKSIQKNCPLYFSNYQINL